MSAQKTKETSPIHFERDTTVAIASATGLTVKTGARFMSKNDKNNNSQEFSGPLGDSTMPTQLPSSSRLFGSLSGDHKTRDNEEPRVEYRAGDLRKKGLSRHPDALLVTPTQIEPLEFTLDAHMNVRESKSAEPHKLMQIPGTIDVLLKTFPFTTPVVYTIFVKNEVPAERIEQLKLSLRDLGRAGADITIRIVKR
jgi:hypothetical protein